jgi:hypothetical protein
MDKITVPDVLIQAHSASMGMVIYEGGVRRGVSIF